jgi:hypothetical protein
LLVRAAERLKELRHWSSRREGRRCWLVRCPLCQALDRFGARFEARRPPCNHRRESSARPQWSRRNLRPMFHVNRTGLLDHWGARREGCRLCAIPMGSGSLAPSPRRRTRADEGRSCGTISFPALSDGGHEKPLDPKVVRVPPTPRWIGAARAASTASSGPQCDAPLPHRRRRDGPLTPNRWKPANDHDPGPSDSTDGGRPSLPG